MAETVPYTAVHAERFARLPAEFERLSSLVEKPFALRDMFDHDGFAIEDYCRGFTPNPHTEASGAAVRRFARRHGIWLTGISDHVTDMGAYLNPRASRERLTSIGKTYAIDWYLDDTIGREKFAAMSDEQRARAARRRERIIALCRSAGDGDAAGSGDAGDSVDSVEEAVLLVLAELRDGSTPEWYERFVRQWVAHLGMMCRDQNARTSGLLPGLQEYTERRIVMSGMPYTITFGEFAADRFLARRALVESGTDALVRRVFHRICAVCSLSNDLFSFPRELREGCDANAVVVEALNHPHLTLVQAVTAAMDRTRRHTAAFLEETAALATAVSRLGEPENLREFMRTTQDALRATWVWQTHSPRYRETRAVFR
ncbi:terpene synthase family protein [Kitasatospora brasiliensis]|uniref:terpene synthase family protein n=1 Tax=Kitasatospora brasiliensis TaxID=3058040 RepID=UPI00292EA9C2|nr:terpene synthase family protein [Kitasatospora sp. K002]